MCRIERCLKKFDSKSIWRRLNLKKIGQNGVLEILKYFFTLKEKNCKKIDLLIFLRFKICSKRNSYSKAVVIGP